MSLTTRYILDDQNHDDYVGGEGGGVGDWQNFVPDVGWSTSTLRYRTVPGGLQFDGAALGSLGAGATARLGVLPIDYRPNRQQVTMCAVISGISYAWGFVVFQLNGDVITWWSAAGTQFIVSCIVALD